jgi:hypothetical protein
VAAIVTKWHRKLTRKHHPDRGGSVEVMQALNDATDELRKMLGVTTV